MRLQAQCAWPVGPYNAPPAPIRSQAGPQAAAAQIIRSRLTSLSTMVSVFTSQAPPSLSLWPHYWSADDALPP